MKPTTIDEMLKIPFKDKQFVRFLKEKQVYPQLIKAIHTTNRSYHEETLNTRYLLSVMIEEKKYLVRLLPWRRNCGINWSKIHDEWVKQLTRR